MSGSQGVFIREQVIRLNKRTEIKILILVLTFVLFLSLIAPTFIFHDVDPIGDILIIIESILITVFFLTVFFFRSKNKKRGWHHNLKQSGDKIYFNK